MAVAAARLRVVERDGRTVVTEASSRSPLRLLLPRNHGGAAWAFQSSHGGGMVGRDEISLAVEVATGGRLFLSSQASGKVYAGADARFSLEATVAADAALVLWPDPLCCFADASFAQHIRLSLHRSASLVCVDAYGAGRVARGERWAFARLALRLELDIDGARALTDAVLLSPQHGDLCARLAGYDAFATVVVAGPRVIEPAIATHALDDEGVLVSLSRWPWGCVLRLAAVDTFRLSVRLRELLRPTTERLLGEDPWERKW